MRNLVIIALLFTSGCFVYEKKGGFVQAETRGFGRIYEKTTVDEGNAFDKCMAAYRDQRQTTGILVDAVTTCRAQNQNEVLMDDQLAANAGWRAKATQYPGFVPGGFPGGMIGGLPASGGPPPGTELAFTQSQIMMAAAPGWIGGGIPAERSARREELGAIKEQLAENAKALWCLQNKDKNPPECK